MDYGYFDQFLDYEVDLTEYLLKISQDNDYNYTFSNIQPVKIKLKNIFTKIDLIEDYKYNFVYFLEYFIQDGEKIEDISYKFYDTTDYWWIICIFNDIKNLFTDLPLSINELKFLAEKMYKFDKKYTYEGYYDILFEMNEKKRKILILKKQYLNDFLYEFRERVIRLINNEFE